ncbi:MAG: class I tRNA ligase family protein [Patescibacteria group bacterium]
MKKYNPKAIEAKWQKVWAKQKLNLAKDGSKKPKFYALIEFPFPSGDGLHVGHMRSYTALDVVARKRRAEGYEVLYPIGWDAFGLPTENYAIKTGRQPALITKQNTTRYRKQLQSLGFSFDWSREVNTTDPNYYKWTQWLFLQFFKKGLAYKAKIAINWCPKDKIGLANEEVVTRSTGSGQVEVCERCGTAVEQREKDQWLLAITKYADRLDRELDLVDYPEPVKLQQRNWIGRREGAEIEFKVINPTPDPLPEGEGEVGEFGYHTTDPNTWRVLQDRALEMRKSPTPAEKILWQSLRNNSTGSHFRRQQIIWKFIADFVCLEKALVIEVDGDIHDYQKVEDEERSTFLRESGFKVIRFHNDEVIKNTSLVVEKIKDQLKALPFGEGLGGVIKIFTTRPETIFGVTFIARAGKADRFTGEYAVNPANQEKIPIWEAEYVMDGVGTGAVMGVPAHDERDLEFAKKHNLPIKDVPMADQETLTKIGAKPHTTYKLRDWVFSRQRYWGEPIPLIFCAKCNEWQPVPDKDLPVKLPKVKKYEPTDNGDSPLANIKSWVETKCPKCGGAARRETDVMPNWAGSSWYYLAYLMKKAIGQRPTSLGLASSNIKHWLPVDWYNGGMEHTTLHLLYSRFWHKVLNDLKLVPGKEPYAKRTSHGLILAHDGEKMSKSRGNVVNPDELVKRFGADTLRIYEMFMGPFGQAIAWSEDGLVGSRRFLERVWKMAEKVDKKKGKGVAVSDLNPKLQSTIIKVGEDIEAMKFNTAISSLMILLNEFEAAASIPAQFFKTFLKLLSPFAPHLADELWHHLGEKKSIHLAPWPKGEKIASEKVKIVIQINGKTRDLIEVSAKISELELKQLVLEQPKVINWVKGKEVVKTIVVPRRLVNLVLGD